LTGRGETSNLSRAGWIPRSVVDGGAGTYGRRTMAACFLLFLAILETDRKEKIERNGH